MFAANLNFQIPVSVQPNGLENQSLWQKLNSFRRKIKTDLARKNP